MDAIATSTATIVDALACHARERPDATAFTFLVDGEADERSLSFAELESRAQVIAGHIHRAAPNAERVLVLQPPGLEFIFSLFACFLAGVAAVPAPPPAARANSNSSQRFARLLTDAAPGAILTNSDLLARSRWLVESQIGLAGHVWITSDACAEPDDPVELPAVAPDDLALIQYTSGSTAEPKGVLIDHANLAANLAAIQSKFELTRDSVGVSWLPPYHDMGLIGGVVSAAWCGYRIVLMDPKHFMARPLRWLETIDRYRADVSGGANFAFDLCADALARTEDVSLDLSRWRLAFSGAEPVRAATIDRFSDAFARHGFLRSSFYPCYGLAEATLIVAGPDPGAERPVLTSFDGDKPEAARTLVSCGTSCPEHALEIVDPKTGEKLADGEEGEIRITGPSITRGYWREQEAEDGASLATGDLGLMWQGQLYVTGRLKDLIIVRGRNIAPGDVEDAIARCHPALAPAASAAFAVDIQGEEGFVVAAEIRREHRRDTEWPAVFAAMRSRIVEQTGAAPADMVLLRPGALARTTSGKVRRHACRHDYLNGAWNPLACTADISDIGAADASDISLRMVAATRAERWASLQDYLVWRLAQLTATPTAFLTSDVATDAIGLDSLKQVEFALLVDRDLGVSLPVDWPGHAQTLGDLARLIEESGTRASALAGGADPIADPKAKTTVPMTPRQAAFFDGNPAEPEHFAEVLYFRTPNDVNAAALKRALSDLVDAHDAFSLRFERGSGKWTARIGSRRGGVAFERMDIGGLNKSEFAAVRSDVLKRVHDSFSLSEGPLVSAVFLDRGAGQQGIMVVGFHHLVIDAVSLSAWVVRFQSAYECAVQGRPADLEGRSNGYVPWLRALDAYAQSRDLADELEYWKDVCGPADAPPEKPLPRDPASWRSTGKTTLPADVNQMLLERYRTPLARNGLVFAAVCRAWAQATGDEMPLVMMESHGRHPFAGTDPSTAVGWFASRYPMSMHVPTDIDAVDFVGAATLRVSQVPKLGHGYGLLRRKPPGDPLRIEMDNLRKPTIHLQYRGNIDETFRSDAAFPVISVHHETRAYGEAARNLGDVQSLAVMAGLSDGVLYWSVFHLPPISGDAAQDVSDQIRRFFVELSALQ